MSSERVSVAMRITAVAFGFLLAAGLVAVAEITARHLTDFAERQQRGQPVVEGISIADPYASDAYRGFPWLEDYRVAQAGKDSPLHYEPYVLWMTSPLTSKYVNRDADGYRRTVNPPKPGCTSFRQLWVLGSSTIAGDGIMRDEDLIPSLLSARLNAAMPDACIEVRNYGISGYIQGNEYVQLMLLLARGQRPDLVIFYGGANDLSQHVVAGLPHMAYQAFYRLTETWAGTDSIPGFLALATQKLARRSALLSLFLPASTQDVQLYSFVLPSDTALIQSRSKTMADEVCGTMRVVGQLARAYGFGAVFALQPTIFTKAELSAEEAGVARSIEANMPGLKPGSDAGYPMLAARMAEQGCGVPAFDLRGAIATPRSIFLDYGHISPRGNELVAAAISEKLLADPTLRRQLRGDDR